MSRFTNKKIAAVIAAAMLLTAAVPYTAMAMPSGGKAVVDGILVRKTAVNGEPVGSLSQGQSVSVISETTGSDGKTWYEVKYTVNGQEFQGYVRSDLLNATGETTETPAEPEVKTIDVTFTYDDLEYSPAAEIDEESIPTGFSASTITVEDKEIPAFTSSDGQIQVISLVDQADKENTGLFMYHAVDGSVSPFVIVNIGTGYVVFLDAPDGIEVSETYMPVDVYLNGASFKAYEAVSADFIDQNTDTTGMFIVYGMDETGSRKWYSYDSELQSIQRSILDMTYFAVPVEEEPIFVEPEPVDGENIDDYMQMLLVGLTAVAGLLFLLFVVVAIRFKLAKRRYNDLKEIAKRKQGKTKEEEQAAVADTVKRKYDVEFLGEEELMAHIPEEKVAAEAEEAVEDLDSVEDLEAVEDLGVEEAEASEENAEDEIEDLALDVEELVDEAVSEAEACEVDTTEAEAEAVVDETVEEPESVADEDIEIAEISVEEIAEEIEDEAVEAETITSVVGGMKEIKLPEEEPDFFDEEADEEEEFNWES